jgi:tetratricopeptide (TPR) repeat protein
MKTDTVTPEGPAIADRISGLFETNSYEQAVSELRKFLEENPDDIAAIHLLGTAYARSNNFISAEKAFKRVLKSEPSHADACFNLGLIHTSQNRLSEAIEDFEKVLELNPEDIQSLNDLGAINFGQGNVERSRELFKKALKINPVFKDAFLNLFELCWNNGNYTEALEHAHSFLKELETKTGKTAPDQNIVTDETPIREPGPKPGAIVMKNNAEYKSPAIISSQSMAAMSSDKLELFNEHVPENLRDKKTGMNIAIVADFNIAGQVTGLFRLINEHTIHRARCIIFQDDYLSYDHDIILSRKNSEDWETARQIIKNADFLHIGRFPKQNADFPLLNCIKPTNTIVQYYGSELRQNAKAIYSWHQQNKITGLAAWDYTMLENSPFFYHINMMFDASRVKPAPKPEGTIRIVHPTTNRHIKKTDLFIKAVESLQKKYDIEPVIIEGKTNEECLEIKSQAHMTYDQISVGIYGVSAIESMAAGHVVFGGISNFAASIYPDNPIVWITPDDLASKIESYLLNRVSITERGLAGKAWVERYHNPRKILKQYMYLYDFVKNGHRFMQSPDEQILG